MRAHLSFTQKKIVGPTCHPLFIPSSSSLSSLLYLSLFLFGVGSGASGAGAAAAASGTASGRPLELRTWRPNLPLASFLLPIDCAMAVAAAPPTMAASPSSSDVCCKRVLRSISA
uniref:Uncharacterized protein n=1 Tax=Oryza glaberrima TaxID=4538 RepID=A0A679BB42_ORYGL|nr:hypothetical protein [Oryza glaberrima]